MGANINLTSVELTQNSKNVIVNDVIDLTSVMTGWSLYVVGAPLPLEISSGGNQSLVLTENSPVTLTGRAAYIEVNVSPINELIEKTNELAGQTVTLMESFGTAATQNVTTSPTDTTSSRITKVGDFGLGTNAPPKWDLSMDACGFWENVADTYGYVTLTRDGSRAGYIKMNLNGASVGSLSFSHYNPSDQTVFYEHELLHSGNANSLPLTDHFAQQTDALYDLGKASRRWNIVRAASGTINTSDAREKDNYRALSEDELNCACELAQNIGIYQWLEAIEKKGVDDARLHAGMYVQDAITIFESHNLDPMRYGLICYDSWDDEYIEHPAEFENGELIKEAWTEQVQFAGDRYGFRYEQLNQFLLAGQAAKLSELEQRLAAAGL